MSVVDSVRSLVAPVLEADGLELVDVEHGPGLLRVYVDTPDGGIDLDTITDATQVISALLDEHDPVPGSYTLEVSSPGLERPLRTPEHFRRFVGHEVNVKTTPGVPGDRRVKGSLVTADDDGFEIRDEHGTVHRLTYGEVERARTVFEWGTPSRPGRSSKKKRATS